LDGGIDGAVFTAENAESAEKNISHEKTYKTLVIDKNRRLVSDTLDPGHGLGVPAVGAGTAARRTGFCVSPQKHAA
jgi:hypothetical protein